MAQVNAGRVRFVAKGEYNNATQYYTFDLVNYNGNSYYAKENTIGNLPTDTTKWQLVAEKGNVGSTGPTGAPGNGIASITKTSTSGLVDTYTITYTDGTTTTYQVTNGEDGKVTQAQLDEVQEELDRYKMLENALPKVTGEGTNVTLNDTANAPMKMIPMASELSQDGEPTPETPQEIHTISGDNEIVVENKNLFDVDEFINEINRISSGYAEKTTYLNKEVVRYKNNVSELRFMKGKFKENTRYTFKSSVARSGYVNEGVTAPIFYIKYTDGTDGYFANTSTQNSFTNATLISTENKTIDYIYVPNYASTQWVNLDLSVTQIREGTNITDYVEHQEQKYELNLPVKNLFDKNTCLFHNEQRYDDSGQIVTDYNSSYSDLIAVKPNTTYTISNLNGEYSKSVRTAMFDSNQAFIQRTPGESTNNITITTTSTTYYLSIQGRDLNNIDINKIQLEQGTKANSYTEFGTEPLEVCKIDDYEDEFVIPSGKNLFDENKYLTETFATGAYKYALANFKGNRVLYVQSQIKSGKTAISGLYVAFSSDGGNPNVGTTKFAISNGYVSTSTSKDFTGIDNLYLSYYPTSYTWEQILDVYDIWVSTNDVDYEPYGTKWYLKKNIGKVVLDGSENWEKYPGSHAEGFYAYFRAFSSFKIGFQTTKCTHFNNVNSSWIPELNKNGRYSDHQSLAYRYFVTNEYDTNTKFKEFVANEYQNNTPITLYGKLATPTYTLLNDTLQTQLNNIQKVLAYQNQTNVSQVNNDLPFTIKASAIRDMSNIFELIQGTEL